MSVDSNDAFIDNRASLHERDLPFRDFPAGVGDPCDQNHKVRSRVEQCNTRRHSRSLLVF